MGRRALRFVMLRHDSLPSPPPPLARENTVFRNPATIRIGIYLMCLILGGGGEFFCFYSGNCFRGEEGMFLRAYPFSRGFFVEELRSTHPS